MLTVPTRYGGSDLSTGPAGFLELALLIAFETTTYIVFILSDITEGKKNAKNDVFDPTKP